MEAELGEQSMTMTIYCADLKPIIVKSVRIGSSVSNSGAIILPPL